MMRFYDQQHGFYGGVDLHARSMHVCIVDQASRVQVHKNIEARPDHFLSLVQPYRESLVIGAECMFAWYWLADVRMNNSPQQGTEEFLGGGGFHTADEPSAAATAVSFHQRALDRTCLSVLSARAASRDVWRDAPTFEPLHLSP